MHSCMNFIRYAWEKHNLFVLLIWIQVEIVIVWFKFLWPTGRSCEHKLTVRHVVAQLFVHSSSNEAVFYLAIIRASSYLTAHCAMHTFSYRMTFCTSAHTCTMLASSDHLTNVWDVYAYAVSPHTILFAFIHKHTGTE